MSFVSPERADYHFRGVPNLPVLRLLEVVRVEELAQHRLDLVAAIQEGLGQLPDCLWIARLFDIPSGHLGLVGDEEVVHVPGDEPGAGLLLEDDVDDVLAVEVALVTEKRLLGEVVVLGLEVERPLVSTVGIPGHLGVDCPAGECSRALEHIGLGVVTDTEG